MSRARLNRRGFRRPPRIDFDLPGGVLDPNDEHAANRLRDTIELGPNEAYIVIYSANREVWFVLHVTPDYKGPVPELPETFEGRRVFSEPVGHMILA